jgi:hypothetical protein
LEEGDNMKTKSFFYLLIACILSLTACGLSPAEIATQTAVAQTAVAASWTATPTLTPTLTLTPTGTFTLTPTETETPTPTPGPCTAENLPGALKEIKELQVQFDNLSKTAANTEREQLPDEITQLQSLLQTAETQATPSCLATLRNHQLKHMQLVVDTLKAFVDRVDQKIVDDLLKQARDEHHAYDRELIHVLGITPTP